MDFEGVGSIFELVADLGSFGRKLFRFADGNETRSEPIGQRGRENESASFHADDYVHLAFGVMIAELVYQLLKPMTILKQRREIVEKDSRFWIIRDFPNGFFQIFHCSSQNPPPLKSLNEANRVRI